MTTLLAAAAVSAVALGGCSNQTTTARCVDKNGNVLPDSVCQNNGTGYGGGGSYGGSGGGATAGQGRWVYGGEGGTSPGSRATGFSTTAPDSGDISSPSGTVVRGGFGGEGEGHGGDGGDGGGHGGGGE